MRDKAGYVWVLAETSDQLAWSMARHSRESRYVSEHRLVVARSLGRRLETNERVHHINGIRDDNRPENLKLFGSQSEHMKHVHLEVCPHCGGALRT